MRYNLRRARLPVIPIPVLLGLTVLGGCQRDSQKDSVPAPPPSAAPQDAVSHSNALLALGVTGPEGSGRTFAVDPFLLALALQDFTNPADPCGLHESRDDGCGLTGVGAGTPLALLGMRDGDVVTHVETARAGAPAEVVRALDGAAARVQLTLLRDGVSLVFEYRLVERLAWQAFTGEAQPGEAESGVPAATEVAEPSPPPRTEPSGAGSKTTPTLEPKKPPRESPKPSTPSKPKPSPSGASGTNKPTPTPTPTPTSRSVQCSSAAACTMEEATFRKLLASPAALMNEGKIVPAIANDVHSGYKIKSVKRGGVIDQLGFRPEDKITHINGTDLTDDASALSLYLGAGSVRTFRITYLRGGQRLTKVVQVQ